MTGFPTSPMDLTVLYRGPLASCDYDCPYCPFAKRRDSREQLRADRAALERFTDWATAQTGDRLSLLFTPWGEGLVRSWYRRALTELSHRPHIRRVAIQTNLSCRTDWLADADLDTLALWCTYHPGQTPYDRFSAKCHELARLGVRFSVGIVGLPEHLEAARRLRAELPDQVYLWVNAAEGHTYDDAEAEVWTALDPLFPYSRRPHASAGAPCRTGESVISVDGEGTVRRCHFVPDDWATSTTAATGWPCGRGPAPSPGATATSAMSTWRRCRCTTCSRAVSWNASRCRPRGGTSGTGRVCRGVQRQVGVHE
ncbi:hypothetical protein SHIRM173S_05923 [Streptomyces hirsutus]